MTPPPALPSGWEDRTEKREVLVVTIKYGANRRAVSPLSATEGVGSEDLCGQKFRCRPSA